MTDNDLRKTRDALRAMFRRWHVNGPHATYDAPVIEQAILALDVHLAQDAALKGGGS
jgi:hypothetical protein